MATSNIRIAGATYPDVPSVTLKDTSNNDVSFVLTSDATASADKIEQGYTAYVNGQKIVGTSTGGGGGAVVVTEETLPTGGVAKHITAVDISNDTVDADHLAQGYTAHDSQGNALVGTMTGGGGTDGSLAVRFLDYDGTVVASYSAEDFANLSAMPSNPSHTGLTAQGWNWTLADAKEQVAEMGACDIGQMYITDDGKTRIYCHFTEDRLAPYFGIGVNGTVVVDWGDGSATDTLTGTSLTTVKTVQHTYASEGDYVIILTVSSGSFSFLGTSNTSYILRKEESTTANVHKVYTNAVRKIELGSNVTIGSYAFGYCHNMKSITIPNTVTSIGSFAFSYCYSLSSMTIPNGVTSILSYLFLSCGSLSSITIPNAVIYTNSTTFGGCSSLSSITIPNTVTNISSYLFQSCYSLSSMTIPNRVTSISSYAFNNCCSLSSMTIPNGVTSIGNSAFSNCYGVAEYHLLPTTPPTLGTTVFSNIQSDCKIYVPSASLEAYKTATNWSTYADYMVGE